MHIARYALYLAVPTLGAALYFLTPLPRPLFAPDYSTLIVARDGQLLRAFLNRDQQWCFPPDTSLAVPAKLQTAVLHFEDRRFYRHLGVDPLALGRALYQNAATGAVKSGASTITMQVARLMRPKERTYVNKARETLLALKIELYYAKDEILRLYLDHAPYGGNIVGYQAAAHKYFRKPPDKLTYSEAATLAVLPNAPGLVSPTANPQQLVQKRNRLLTSLQRAGHFDAETLRLALAEPVPTRAFPYPVGAPHLSRALKRGRQGRLIKTTIDAGLQRELEALVGRHLRYLDHQGIGNGAALLVETGSGKVRAYVGSRDFFDPGAPRAGRWRDGTALFGFAAQTLSLRPEHGRRPDPAPDPSQGRTHFLWWVFPAQRRRALRRPSESRRGPSALPQRPGRAPLAALWPF